MSGARPAPPDRCAAPLALALQAVVLFILVPLILVKFNGFVYHRFLGSVACVPLTMARNAPPAHVVTSAYIPPPMQPGSYGWNPEWSKPWQGWNMPTGYGVV